MSRTFHRDEAMVEADLLSFFMDDRTAIHVNQVDAEVRDVAFAVGHGFIVCTMDAEQGFVLSRIHKIGRLECPRDVEHPIHRAAVARVSRESLKTSAHAHVGDVDLGWNLVLLIHIRVVERNEPSRADAAQINAVGVNVPRVAVVHRVTEEPHCGPAVMNATPHGFDKFRRKVAEDVDPETIAHRRHDVAHLGQILTQGNHFHAVVAPCQKESAVRNHHQRTRLLGVSFGRVDVHHELFRQKIDVEVFAVRNVVVHRNPIKRTCVSVSVTVALILREQRKSSRQHEEKSEGFKPRGERSLDHVFRLNSTGTDKVQSTTAKSCF